MSKVAELADVIVDFIRGVGITVETAALPEDGFLPAIAVRDGGWSTIPTACNPGDLLHEAGHIAVTDPALRPRVSEFDSNGGDGMAAIGWSYAAALAAGIDPRVVFHDFGYRAGGRASSRISPWAAFSACRCCNIMDSPRAGARIRRHSRR